MRQNTASNHFSVHQAMKSRPMHPNIKIVFGALAALIFAIVFGLSIFHVSSKVQQKYEKNGFICTKTGDEDYKCRPKVQPKYP